MQQTAPCWQFHNPLSGKWPSAEEDSFKDLASDDHQRNPSVIAARLLVSLSVGQWRLPWGLEE